MRTGFVICDSDGVVKHAGFEGVGFALTPARPNTTTRPGSYPVQVKLSSGRILDVANGDAVFLEEPFARFDIIGGESGDGWLVTVLERRGEGIIRSGAKQRVGFRVQAATAVGQVNPAAAGDGFKVRPGTLAHTFYFSGTSRLNRIWVRTIGGTWVDTGEDLDPATDGPVFTRTVRIPGDRIALVANGAAQLVEIDAEVEVG